MLTAKFLRQALSKIDRRCYCTEKIKKNGKNISENLHFLVFDKNLDATHVFN